MSSAKAKRIRRVEKAVGRLSRLSLIYKLGGARDYNPEHILEPSGAGVGWSDCSGFAAYLCAVAGLRLKHPAGWTGTLVEEGKQGTSPYLTLYIKDPYDTEGHVIVRLRHHPRWRRALGMAAKWRWAECGGRDNPKSGGGPTWFRPTDERVAEFPYQRHFEAL
jgi:hypothetical protein